MHLHARRSSDGTNADHSQASSRSGVEEAVDGNGRADDTDDHTNSQNKQTGANGLVGRDDDLLEQRVVRVVTNTEHRRTRAYHETKRDARAHQTLQQTLEHERNTYEPIGRA